LTDTRQRYSAAFKARVALEAAKQTRTLAELSEAFQVHPIQISQWMKQLLDDANAERVRPCAERRTVDPSAPSLKMRLGSGVFSKPAGTQLQWQPRAAAPFFGSPCRILPGLLAMDKWLGS
jgi:hypothetical protein